MTHSKWLIYMVLLGLLPVILRALLAVLTVGPMSSITAADVTGFGLLLAVTNFNGLENEPNLESGWKTQSMGITILTTAMLVCVLVASILADAKQGLFNQRTIFWCSVLLAFGAVVHSFVVWNRIITVQGAKQ